MVVKALPVPPCLRGQLMACFMSLQRRASLLGHRFHSDTPPHSCPSPSQRRDGWIGGLRTTIYMSPSAGADLSRKKKKSPTSPHDSSEAGRPFVICDSRLYEVTRVARSEGNHHPGDGKSNSANLWHISRNCHFLQSHKRGGELLALVSCVAFPCRLLQWNSPDSHRVSKSE